MDDGKEREEADFAAWFVLYMFQSVNGDIALGRAIPARPEPGAKMARRRGQDGTAVLVP